MLLLLSLLQQQLLHAARCCMLCNLQQAAPPLPGPTVCQPTPLPPPPPRPPAVVAVCGAEAPVTLDGQPVPMWSSFAVKRGQVVKVGATQGGSRAYVAVAGGFDVPGKFI